LNSEVKKDDPITSVSDMCCLISNISVFRDSIDKLSLKDDPLSGGYPGGYLLPHMMPSQIPSSTTSHDSRMLTMLDGSLSFADSHKLKHEIISTGKSLYAKQYNKHLIFIRLLYINQWIVAQVRYTPQGIISTLDCCTSISESWHKSGTCILHGV
jgi:hypothetical protein